MNETLVVIDPGHGGIDSGATSNNIEEKNLNLRVSKYIYNRLKDLNVPVVITREEDEYLPKEDRIKRIKEITNNNPNTLLISNHMNAGGGEGAEVVFSLNNKPTLAEMILSNIESKGQIARKIYQRRLPENPNKDYYYILRETNSREPILIEYGFIDNKKDQEKLLNNIESYGEGVVEAITNYLGIPYSNDTQNTYTVKKGDTLYSLSKIFNIPISEIKRINNLTTDTLTIGQVLTIKEVGQLNNSSYIVNNNDTLWSIAKKYGIKVDDIVKANNLTTDILSIGEELIIPSTKIENTEEFSIYTIKKGDSLWQISKNFGIPIPDLIEINNLTNLTIYEGQKLLVPNKDSEEYYVVQNGDTLWSIAKSNDMTIDELKTKNNLTSNLLKIGQKLII